MAETDIRERFKWAASKHRRKLAADKLELLEGNHEKTLHALIRSRMTNPSVAEQIIKWSSTSRNLLVQIVRTCCQAYSRGCVRDLAPTVGEPAIAAFSSVLAESQINIVSALINQYSWLLGPTFVLPQVEEDGSWWLDLVPANRAAVILKNPSTVSELLFQRPDGLFVHLDSEAWRYYDSEGEPFKGVEPRPHGLGYAPVAVFRSEHWTNGGWWNEMNHRALVDAALDVANLEALLHYSRKQSNKQLVVYSPREAIAGQQIVGAPEAPLIFDGSPADAKVEVIDLESNATTYLDLIAAKTAGVCELYGLPPSLLSGVNSNADWGQVGLARAPEVLDALRDSQIPGLRFGEAQLWPAVCDLLRASNHRLAHTLPSGADVRDALRLKFLEPLPNIDRAKKRLELFSMQEKLGLASVTDLILEDRPELTREQAEQIVADNMSRHLARVDALAARNIPAGTDAALETVAQAQGRTGGLTRAANAHKAAENETSPT